MKLSLAKYECKLENSILKIPTLMKRIKNKVKEAITSEKIRKKTVANILQSESEKIRSILAYSNFEIDNYPKLDIKYNINYISIIASILKQFTTPFIGEMNLNLAHQNIRFYKNLEFDIPSHLNR